eukprot:SAG22_NODE_352_length_11827_cov_3.941252_6_plen_118_part_00
MLPLSFDLRQRLSVRFNRLQISDWERGEQEAFVAALTKLRGSVPHDIARTTRAALVEQRGMPPEFAKRLFERRVLWFVWCVGPSVRSSCSLPGLYDNFCASILPTTAPPTAAILRAT